MTPELASEVVVDAPPRDATALAAYLESLIETQPVCLMRVDLDGRLMAANTAALQLLGADDHAQVLDHPLSDRIPTEHHEDWRGFLDRTCKETSGSVECEIIDLRGTRRAALVQAIAQRSPLDGVPSMILTVQDISVRRRLESTLEQHQAGAVFDELQQQLQTVEGERQRLASLLDERDKTERETNANYAVERAESERLRAAMTSRLEETTKAVAAYGVELAQIMENNVRNLEPMAAAGRIAASVARDVQAIVAEVDSRTKDLLTSTDPQAPHRHDVEVLRGSFLRISSMIRQLVQATGGSAS